MYIEVVFYRCLVLISFAHCADLVAVERFLVTQLINLLRDRLPASIRASMETLPMTYKAVVRIRDVPISISDMLWQHLSSPSLRSAGWAHFAPKKGPERFRALQKVSLVLSHGW